MTDYYISYAEVEHRQISHHSFKDPFNSTLENKSKILFSTILLESLTEETNRHTECSGRNFYDISFCGYSMKLLSELLFWANTETRLCKASANENNAVRPSRLQFHCSCTKCFWDMLPFCDCGDLNGLISFVINIFDRKNDDVNTKTKIFTQTDSFCTTSIL